MSERVGEASFSLFVHHLLLGELLIVISRHFCQVQEAKKKESSIVCVSVFNLQVSEVQRKQLCS